jgi:hypothetical protein
MLVASSLAISACGAARPAAPIPQPQAPHASNRSPISPAQLLDRAQQAVLLLPRGRSTAQFVITALPPPTHIWTVLISASASADFEVHIRTWYGTWLGVLPTTHNHEWCRNAGTEVRCALTFPELEAQRAGSWTVIARKRSYPAARVHIRVTFSRP